MGNRWGVQASYQFTGTGLSGKTSNGNYCWTLPGELSESAIDAGGSSFASIENRANWLVECGSAAGTSGMLYTILDDASDVDGNGNSTFDTTYNGIRIFGAYVDSTLTKRNNGGNDRILIVNDYSSSPIIVNESTRTLDIALPVTNAASTQLYSIRNMAHFGAGIPFLYIRSN